MITDCHLAASFNENHGTQVVEGSYHLQLIRFHLNSTLWSAVNWVSAPYYQDYEQSTEYRAMVDPTIYHNFLVGIKKNTYKA